MYQTNLRLNQSLFFNFTGFIPCELAKGHRGDINKGRILGAVEVLNTHGSFTEHQRPLLLSGS